MVDFSLFTKAPSKGGYTYPEVLDIAEILGINIVGADGSSKLKKREIGRKISSYLTDHHKRATGDSKFRWFWGGILPTVVDEEGEPLYLLGLEQTGEWSIIGGGREKSDFTPLITAAREGYEETMGFLGDEWELIAALMKPEVQQMHLKAKYALYLMPVEYDKNLPGYFRRVLDYFKKCSRESDHPKLQYQIPTCPSGFFELVALEWYREQDILDALAGRNSGTAPPLKNVTRQIFKALWGDIPRQNDDDDQPNDNDNDNDYNHNKNDISNEELQSDI